MRISVIDRSRPVASSLPLIAISRLLAPSARSAACRSAHRIGSTNIVWTWILRSRSAQTSKRRLAGKRETRRVAFATPRQEILLRSNAQAIRPNSPRYARSLLSYSTGVPSSFR